MHCIDLVDFDFAEHKGYGFGQALVVGRDIFEYERFEKHLRHPAILKSDDAEAILRSLSYFDTLYFTRYETNVELMTAAKNKGKPFLVSLSDILGRRGFSRALAMYRISRFLEFCRSYKAGFVICSKAKDIYGVRDPDEICEICRLLGLEPEKTRAAMSHEWSSGD